MSKLQHERAEALKICGIVAEYNPFHNGHLYQAEQARRLSGCDAVVAVLSGNFVQRGEPAAFDKWARARMALSAGMDAVFELPAFYALQSADWFAYGGVSVLHGLGLDALSFGSEISDLDELMRMGELRAGEDEAVRVELRRGLDAGLSHPRAHAQALEAVHGAGSAAAAGQPNAVLALMYLRWLRELGSAMTPVVVHRVGAQYHDGDIAGSIASATAVRRSLRSGDPAWQTAVPNAVAVLLEEELSQGRIVDPAALDAMLLYALRGGARWPDDAEGLGNRVGAASIAAGTAEELYFAVKSKRYTLARIRRAALQALLGITAQDIEALRQARPTYARLLGYSRRVDGLVNELANRCSIPFIVRTAQFEPADAAQQRLWQLDLLASNLYALMMKNPAQRRGDRDFTEKLIVI